ncbi:MAG: hypothetical protein ACR2P3_14845 [Geminicoccaceae bacterium]
MTDPINELRSLEKEVKPNLDFLHTSSMHEKIHPNCRKDYDQAIADGFGGVLVGPGLT